MLANPSGYCQCGAPLTVQHTRSGTCRRCQVHNANVKMRLPPWDVIQANIDRIVAEAIADGSCYAYLDQNIHGPVMGHKL